MTRLAFALAVFLFLIISVACAVKHNPVTTTQRHLKKSRRKTSFKKGRSSHKGKKASKKIAADASLEWNDAKKSDDDMRKIGAPPTCQPLIHASPDMMVLETVRPVIHATNAPHAPEIAVPVAVPAKLPPSVEPTQQIGPSSITKRPELLQLPSAVPSETPFAREFPSSAPSVETTLMPSMNQDPVLGDPTTTEPSIAPVDNIPSTAPSISIVETTLPTRNTQGPLAVVVDSSVEPSEAPVRNDSPSAAPTTAATRTPFGMTNRPTTTRTDSRRPTTLQPQGDILPTLEPSDGNSDTPTSLPTVEPSRSSPSDGTTVFGDDDIIRRIEVELIPFQLLYSPGTVIRHSDKGGILQTTKEHLSNKLAVWETSFQSLELFPLVQRDEKKGTTMMVHQGWTRITFAGSAFFVDHDVLLRERVEEATMLAFLGTNLTEYTQLLQNLPSSITKAQLYTIHGDKMAYVNGAMYMEAENFKDLRMEGDGMTPWIYTLAIALISIVSLLLCASQFRNQCSYSSQVSLMEANPDVGLWRHSFHRSRLS